MHGRHDLLLCSTHSHREGGNKQSQFLSKYGNSLSHPPQEGTEDEDQNPPAGPGRRLTKTEYLIRTQPIAFDQNKVLFEVDYQGQEVRRQFCAANMLANNNPSKLTPSHQGNSVPRVEREPLVNGMGPNRNAPPPQFRSFAELTQAKKDAALAKHKEWEEKRAAKLGYKADGSPIATPRTKPRRK
eukprot:sb/3471435/